MHQLLAGPRRTTRVLVLAPTRELAAQIDEHRVALGRYTDLRGGAVYGRGALASPAAAAFYAAAAMPPQEAALRRGVEIVVATPGRLLDHLRYPYARLDRVD